MSIEIRPIDPEELEPFLHAMGVPFSIDPTEQLVERFRKVFEHERLRAAFDGDQIVATFGAHSLQLAVPGNIVPTAGTSVVTVLTTHRRQGILRSMMTEHLREVRDNGEPLAALWASESSIYGRFGYGPATELMHMSIAKPYARLNNPPEIAGTMRIVSRDEALEIFPQLLEQVARRRPGVFLRTGNWWQNRFLLDPEERRGGASAHRRVVYYHDNQPAGYAVYRTKPAEDHDSAEVRVVELIGRDEQAEQALWQYLFGVDLAGKISYWNLPTDDALEHWLVEPRRAERKIVDALWVRLVDVPAALEARRYPNRGAIVFRLLDEQCPWNNGVFRLTADDDGTAACVPANADPEIELTPFALGSVYLGGRRFRDLARAGLLTGNTEALRRGDTMFDCDRKPWCQEVF